MHPRLFALGSEDILQLLTTCKAHGLPLPKGALSSLWDHAAYDAVDHAHELECTLFTTAAHCMAEEGSTKVLRRLARRLPAILTELCGEFPAWTVRPAGVRPIFYAACAGQMKAFDFLLKFSPNFDTDFTGQIERVCEPQNRARSPHSLS